ncbi:MAG: serine hydrolase domain-containing protein, partial [Planctomycetota bacterium]
MLTRTIFGVVSLLWIASPAAGKGLPVAAPEQVGLSGKKLAEIGPFVQKYIDAQEMSGAITIIARRGKVIHFEAHGLMDVNANKPMQEDAIFRIYSMTKPVVAVAVMRLYEEGKIDLNDPISRYLPAMK